MPIAKPQAKKSVTVEDFHQQNSSALGLQLLSGHAGLNRKIREPTVNRPGLVLAGFTKYFAKKRIQVIGSAESNFLKSLSSSEREVRYRDLMSRGIPCLVFCRKMNPEKVLLKIAEEKKIPVFKSDLITMKFINLATLALELDFAPRGSVQGSMVDILGVGVILRGESGIGKSESVLALIERGYSLVSDDVTRVTILDGVHVIGTSAETTRNHMEVRGIGIINVAAMFGVKSIRKDKQVDLVVTLKVWDNSTPIERVGMDDEFTQILGIDVPHIIIPVRPGRDLARLVEVAAFQTKLKTSGYNSAKELNDRLIHRMTTSGKLRN